MNKIKKIMALLLITVVAVVFVGCSVSASDAQAVFEETMEALKSCDKDRIDEYYSFAELSAFASEAAGEELKETIISTLASVEYKVNSASAGSNGTVKLNVEINTIDFSAVMKDYIDNVMTLVDSESYKANVQSMTDEAYQKLMAEKMIEAIENHTGERASRTIDVTMIKIDDEWKLGGDSDEFLGALFANMSEAVAALI